MQKRTKKYTGTFSKNVQIMRDLQKQVYSTSTHGVVSKSLIHAMRTYEKRVDLFFAEQPVLF